MIDSGWLSWFNFTKCFVYRFVCAVGVWGEGWEGEGERVGCGEAHGQRVVEAEALEQLQLLAHVHAPRGWDVACAHFFAFNILLTRLVFESFQYQFF